MQFTTFLTTVALAAAAGTLAAPSANLESRASNYEFHAFTDADCKNSAGDTISGPPTTGSQCINVSERIGGAVYAATSPQGCKIFVFLGDNKNCNGEPVYAALPAGSNACSKYQTPIASIRVEC